MTFEAFPEDSPFSPFQISSHDPLRNLENRQTCDGCKRSIRYFCYRCIRLAPELSPEQVPTVKLPMHLSIVKDKRELDGKSTVIHAKILADKDTSFHTFDRTVGADGGLDVSKFDPKTSVILFPSPDSKPVEAIDWSQVKQVVVLDGTWQQAKAMCNTSALIDSIPKVHLSTSHKTCFWRYQNLGPHCLSTIEAIYYFYHEYLVHRNESVDGLDDLLFFFSFFYHMVQDNYKANPDRQIHTKLGSDYIKYDKKDD